jgi:hypothetical protein
MLQWGALVKKGQARETSLEATRNLDSLLPKVIGDLLDLFEFLATLHKFIRARPVSWSYLSYHS